MRSTLLLLLALAHGLARAADPRPAAEAFFTTLQQGQISAAYTKLLEGSNIPKDKGTGLAIHKQTERVLPQLGKIIGYEILREEKLGTSLVRLVYLLKSERHPSVWEFYFYKPRNAWFVSQVRFSDQFDWLDAKR
jgi:hypothetical protein